MVDCDWKSAILVWWDWNAWEITGSNMTIVCINWHCITGIIIRKFISETDLWLAPEVLRSDENIDWKASDVYSFAVIVSEILNKAKAYSDMDKTPEGNLQSIYIFHAMVLYGIWHSLWNTHTFFSEIVTMIRNGDTIDCEKCHRRHSVRPVGDYDPESLDIRDSEINLELLRLVCDCWDETPARRPELRIIMSVIRDMMKGK